MAYEDAATFLAQALPWPVLQQPGAPPEFFVNIHSPFRLQSQKLAFPGRAAQTVREAINYIQYTMGRQLTVGAAPPDIYVCMSAQRMAKAKQAKNGRTYYSASRGITNAIWHKSFYIDVDVKPGAFASTEAAIDALGAFIKAVDLPAPSYIIASGSGGFHVHWVLYDPIPTSVWLPLAQALVTAMVAHNFVVDYGCTTDAARLLRVPNTLNYKHTPPAPVEMIHAGTMYVLERISDALKPYVATGPVAPRRSTGGMTQAGLPAGFGPISKLAKPAELVPNQTDSLPTITQLAKACSFVDKTCANGGKDHRQPLWFEAAKLAFYTSTGAKALRMMGNQHPTYSETESDEMFARIEAERTPVDMYGWPHCHTIQLAGATECAACPWMIAGRTGNRSPLHFLGEDYRDPNGQKNLQSQATQPGVTALVSPTPVTSQVTTTYGDKPDGWHHDGDGRMYREVQDPQDPTILVKMFPWPYPMRNLTPTHNPSMVMFDTIVDQRGWIPIAVPCSFFTDARSLARSLAEQGFVLASIERVKDMGVMLASFVEQLRSRPNAASVGVLSAGWVYHDGALAGFNYGRMRYSPTGETPSIMRDRTMQTHYQPTGELSVWKQAMKTINDQHRPALEAIVAASIGSPFMEFTGEHGLMWSARSTQSAVQKSTAMKVAQSVWGHPTAQLAISVDTYNSINTKMGLLNNLPFLWDEVQAKKASDLFSILYDLAQGKSKQRLNRSSELMEVNTWALMLIIATNASMIEVAEQSRVSTAGIYRVFEFDVPPGNGLGNDPMAYSVLGQLDQNYGTAGAELARWMGANTATVKQKTEDMLKIVRDDLKATHGERFWTAGIACALMGAEVANTLQLAQFDVDALYGFLSSSMRKLRGVETGSDAGVDKIANLREVISTFFNLDTSKVLITDHAVKLGTSGKPAPGSIKLKNFIGLHNTAREVNAQWAEDDQILRLSRARLSAWLKKQEHNRNTIYAEMVTRLGAKHARASLGAGTQVNTANEFIIEFDMTHPDLQDLL